MTPTQTMSWPLRPCQKPRESSKYPTKIYGEHFGDYTQIIQQITYLHIIYEDYIYNI